MGTFSAAESNENSHHRLTTLFLNNLSLLLNKHMIRSQEVCMSITSICRSNHIPYTTKEPIKPGAASFFTHWVLPNETIYMGEGSVLCSFNWQSSIPFISQYAYLRSNKRIIVLLKCGALHHTNRICGSIPHYDERPLKTCFITVSPFRHIR